jgi:hypothetical protein
MPCSLCTWSVELVWLIRCCWLASASSYLCYLCRSSIKLYKLLAQRLTSSRRPPYVTAIKIPYRLLNLPIIKKKISLERKWKFAGELSRSFKGAKEICVSLTGHLFLFREESNISGFWAYTVTHTSLCIQFLVTSICHIRNHSLRPFHI